MVDASYIVRQRLLDVLGPVRAFTTGIYGPDLPEKYDPEVTPGITVATEGGLSHPEAPMQGQRVKIKVWAGKNKYELARQVYRAINDWLHGQVNLDFGANGHIILSKEVVLGQDGTDPDTGWATVLTFYEVTTR